MLRALSPNPQWSLTTWFYAALMETLHSSRVPTGRDDVDVAFESPYKSTWCTSTEWLRNSWEFAGCMKAWGFYKHVGWNVKGQRSRRRGELWEHLYAAELLAPRSGAHLLLFTFSFRLSVWRIFLLSAILSSARKTLKLLKSPVFYSSQFLS